MPECARLCYILNLMTATFEPINNGGATSAQGFSADGVYAGVKTKATGVLDVGVLVSETECAAAAVFTTSRFKAASVILGQKRLEKGQAQAIVANSGCANAATGQKGMADTISMAEMAASKLGLTAEDVLVASTGVIGQRLPMEKIENGISNLKPTANGGHNFATAIMTTDTKTKEVAVKTSGGYTIGGAAKGSGMIHPQMATMLCFLTTDAKVEAGFLKKALKKAADVSFNLISVDGDTSPNDSVFLMANGMSGQKVKEGTEEASLFQEALEAVCIHLAKAIAADGEGASRLIEVTVRGASCLEDARIAARTVVSSPLVKTAVHGQDPNWGRVLAAAARSGAELVDSKVDIYMGDIRLITGGVALPFDEEQASAALSNPEVFIALDLNLGEHIATAWGCDLSAEYVTINSEYTT